MQVKAERLKMLEQQQQVQRMQGKYGDEEVAGAYEDGGGAEGAVGSSPAMNSAILINKDVCAWDWESRIPACDYMLYCVDLYLYCVLVSMYRPVP